MEHGFQKTERVRGVVAEKLFGNLHGFAGFDGGGEMHNGFDLLLGEYASECSRVGEVGDNELCVAMNGLTVSAAQVVIDDHGMAGANQLGSDDTTYVSGTSCDEDFQGSLLQAFSIPRWILSRVTRRRRFLASVE